MADSQVKSTAKRLMKRAAKLVEALQAAGTDASDLHVRLATANDEFSSGRYHEAELLAEEVVVIANALRHGGGRSSGRAGAPEPSPKLLRAVGAEVSKSLKKFLAGRPLESRVRKLAREIVERAAGRERSRTERSASRLSREEAALACRELEIRLDLEGRLSALLAGKELGERLAAAISEAIAELPDEERIGVLAAEAVREGLYGKELATLVAEAVDRGLERCPPPTREEIETLAVERLSREIGGGEFDAAIRNAAKEVADGAIADSDLVGAEQSRATAREVAGEVFPRIFASDGVRERIEELAREVASEAAGKIEVLSREDAAQIAGEVSAVKVREALETALARHVSSEEFDGRVRAVLREALRENPPPTWNEIENCAIQRLRSELGGKNVTDGVRSAARAEIESVLAASEFVSPTGARELAEEVVSSTAGPSPEQVREIAEGVLASRDLPGEARVRELAEELLAGKLSGAMEEVLNVADVEGIAARVVEARSGELLEAVPGEDEIRRLAEEIAAGRIAEALSGVPGEERIGELASAAVAARLEDISGRLPDDAQIRELADAVARERVAEIAAELRGAMPNEAGMRGIASSVAAEQVAAGLARLPGEERVREIAAEAAAEVRGVVPGDERIRELAAGVVEGLVADALSGIPGESRLREIAREVAVAAAAEAADSLPGEERVRELAAEVATGKLEAVVDDVRGAAPDEAGIRDIVAAVAAEKIAAAVRELPGEGRVRELAAEAAGEKSGDLAARIPDDGRVMQLAADVAATKIAEALAGVPGEERLEAIAREACTAGLAEFESRLPGEDRIRELAEKAAGSRAEALAAELREIIVDDKAIRAIAHRAAEEKSGAAVAGLLREEEVRDLAADVVAEKLAAFGDDLRAEVPDEDKIRDVAASVATESVSEAVGKLPGEDRLRELAAEVAAARIAKALEALPGEERIKALAAETIEAKAAELKESIPGDARIRDLAAEAAGGKLEELGSELRAAIPEASAIRDIAAAAAAEITRDAVSALPAEDRVRELAAEKFEELAAGLRTAAPDESAIKDLAAGAVEEKVLEAVGALPGEDRVRELVREAMAEKLAALGDKLRGAMESLPDEQRMKAIAAAAAAAATQKVGAQVDGLPGEDRVRELAAAVLEERGGDAARAPVTDDALSEKLEERLREFGATQAELRNAVRGLRESLESSSGAGVDKSQVENTVRSLLQSYTSSEALSERIVEVASKSAGPSEEEIGAGIRELAGEVIEAKAAELKESIPGDARIRELVAGALAERLSAALEAYTSSEALAARVAEISGGGAGDAAAAAGLPEHLVDRLERLENGFEALPNYLQGTARIYQRLNSLETNLERMPSPEHVEEEISELRQQLTGAAEKLADMPAPQTVREMAESALADTLEHLDRLEAEHSEGRAGEHLRELIRREIESAAPGGGEVDHEEIAKVLGALMGTPQFSEKLKKLLPAEEAPAADGGTLDAAAVKEEVEKRVKERLAEALDGEDFKAELGSLVGVAVKTAQHHELTSTRMLRLKDVQTAANPQEVQSAIPDEQVDELLQQIVSSDDFKVALDDRFRTMLEYIKADVIPRQIKKHKQAEGGEG